MIGLVSGAACAAGAAPIATTVDSAGNVGGYSSIQLNGANPVVSYFDEGLGHLKLATCTAGCATASPTWLVTVVDGAPQVGRYTSLQLNGGNPVIAYNDVRLGKLKLATCTDGCATAAPTWVIVTVGDASADTGRFPSLQLIAGNPVIAYRDRTQGRLKLATCTAGCAGTAPSWVITTVDSDGDTGRFASMQLDAGRPVIAYFDNSSGRVKVATCTSACATSSPTWARSVVDTVPGEDEMQISLQLDAGRPIVSYYDTGAGSLKLGSCTARCGSSDATWVVGTVDPGGESKVINLTQHTAGVAGIYSSMRLRDGKPVIAYYGSVMNCTADGPRMGCSEQSDLRLAVCIADCATASSDWVISTLDNGGGAGWDVSLQVDGGSAIASYYDFARGDLKVARVELAQSSVPSNHTALWWNSSESGWGVDFSHQGNIVFGTLFTYDAAGEPMWLILPSGAKRAGGTFSGTLYRTTGPAFDSSPFTPIGASNLTEVGTMAVAFRGDTASLAYTVNGAAVFKTITKYVFGASAPFCRASGPDRTAATNYQDLWWNASESGWGVDIAHQADVIFATVFTYDASGRGMWLMAPAAARGGDGTFRGDLFRTTGPAFNAIPFAAIDSANLVKVGTLQLRFADGENGRLTYSVNGIGVAKDIVRNVFASPAPVCSG